MIFWDNDPAHEEEPGIGQWDVCGLNSTILPGLAFPEVSPKRKVDRRSGSGKHHGSAFDLGHELTDFMLRLRIWTQEQWDEWERIRRGIDPTEVTSDDKRIFSISHPSLLDTNITSVYLNERSNWRPLNLERPSGTKETIFKGMVIRRPVDSGVEKAAGSGQTKLQMPGNVFEDLEPPLAPSKRGIYPADRR